MKLIALVIMLAVSIVLLWRAWPNSPVVTTQVAGPAYEIDPPAPVASPPRSVRPPSFIQPSANTGADSDAETHGPTWLAAPITITWNEVPVEHALATLAAQVQVAVTFAAHTQPRTPVRLRATAQPCGAVLQALCSQTGHDFTISGRHITIVPAGR